jgi:hypothetical protein
MKFSSKALVELLAEAIYSWDLVRHLPEGYATLAPNAMQTKLPPWASEVAKAIESLDDDDYASLVRLLPDLDDGNKVVSNPAVGAEACCTHHGGVEFRMPTPLRFKLRLASLIGFGTALGKNETLPGLVGSCPFSSRRC